MIAHAFQKFAVGAPAIFDAGRNTPAGSPDFAVDSTSETKKKIEKGGSYAVTC